MMTLLNLLTFLNFSLCSISSGYLYSDNMKSFISKNESRSRPVLFTVKSEASSKLEKSKDLKLKVLAIDNEASSGFTIELNSKGEVKLIKKGLCETVHKKKLKLAKCKDKSLKQRFLWVPEAMFSIFVDRIRQSASSYTERQGRNVDDISAVSSDSSEKKMFRYKKPKRMLRKSNRKADSTELNGESSCEEVSTGCNSNSVKVLGGLANLQNTQNPGNKLASYGNDESSYKSNGTSGIQDKSLRYYVDKFLSGYSKKLFPGKKDNPSGKGNLKARICPQNDLKCNPFTSFLNNAMPSGLNIELLDKSFIKDINEIMTENKISIYRQNRSPSTDSTLAKESEVFFDSECKCRYECVKNPQNNGCFYKLNLDGTLEPILKNKNCCKKAESNICDLKTEFDTKICKKIAFNDYSYLNRSMEKNRTAN